MSRELKFRIYDISRECFHYSSEPTTIDTCQLYIKLNGDISSVKYTNHEINSKNFIIQQYTGLKDKNGTEIYEGDIVVLGYRVYSEKPFIRQIIFKDGCFTYEDTIYDFDGLLDHDKCEIIGNIFKKEQSNKIIKTNKRYFKDGEIRERCFFAFLPVSIDIKNENKVMGTETRWLKKVRVKEKYCYPLIFNKPYWHKLAFIDK